MAGVVAKIIVNGVVYGARFVGQAIGQAYRDMAKGLCTLFASSRAMRLHMDARNVCVCVCVCVYGYKFINILI